MLGGEHARGEGVGCVARFDRDRRLAEHLTAVELLGDEMDRAAGPGIAGGDRARVGVEPLV